MFQDISLPPTSYNSSIFGAYAAQDYQVTFSAYKSYSENLTWEKLENKDWPQMYASSSAPGYSDLQVIVDQLSLEIEVHQNWSYSLQPPKTSECNWTAVPLHNETLNIEVVRFHNNGTMEPKAHQSSKFFVGTDEFLSNKTALPEIQWPVPY
jgi:hypothetical protein